MASVEIHTPDGVMRVRLDRDHFTIGRLSTNDITLPYPHISRRHAELRLNGQTWWIVDLRSTNGLHIGSHRVGESRLAPGAPIMLSPLITLSLLEESAAPSYPLPAAPPSYSQMSAPSFPQTPAPSSYPQSAAPASYPSSYPQTPAPASYPSGYPQTPAPASYPQGPVYPQSQVAPMAAPASYPSPPSVAPLREAVKPLSALGPRSPYADDEAPFYPQMRPMEPARPAQPAFVSSPSHIPSAYPARPSYYPPAAAPMASMEAAPSVFDPQRQAAQVFEQRRTGNVAPSSLLHVCQTCGQRTMPDAVYCQNCHHPIHTECVRCRLSLLPIQDLCPRCQTPNPYSVRRLRRTAGPS